jgi:hypothetical protein
MNCKHSYLCTYFLCFLDGQHKKILPMCELAFVDLTNWYLLIYADIRWWHITYADTRWLWNGPIYVNTQRWVFDMFSSTSPPARILTSSAAASHSSPTMPTDVWRGVPPGTAATATSCSARSGGAAALEVLLKNLYATGSAPCPPSPEGSCGFHIRSIQISTLQYVLSYV